MPQRDPRLRGMPYFHDYACAAASGPAVLHLPAMFPPKTFKSVAYSDEF